MYDNYYGSVYFTRVEEGSPNEIGVLVRREVVDGLGDIMVPVILDENGKEVYGFECWWTPFDPVEE